jgi:hypothetical protein
MEVEKVKTKTMIRSIVVGLALTTLSAIAGAQVSNTSGTASVNVQPMITLALVQSPSWGRVVCPPSGTATYTLDYAAGGVTVTSGDGYAFNDGQNGQYTVTGADSAPVSFSVGIGAFSGSGITVTSAIINGNTTSGTGTLSGSGALTLLIGGVITVASNATVTTQTATVTVTVDYN